MPKYRIKQQSPAWNNLILTGDHYYFNGHGQAISWQNPPYGGQMRHTVINVQSYVFIGVTHLRSSVSGNLAGFTNMFSRGLYTAIGRVGRKPRPRVVKRISLSILTPQ